MIPQRLRSSLAVFSVLVAGVCFAALQLSISASPPAAQPASKPAVKPEAAPELPSKSDNNNGGLATVTVPATIEAFFATDLYAKDAGYVSKVNHDIGDYVDTGHVLAEIEDPELKAQFDKAEAAVQQTQAALEVAKRQLAGMEADLALQQITLRRQQELFAGKAATAQTLDEARAKESVSSATLQTGNAKIKLAEADLAAAKAEAERLKALLQYDKIVAPFDCVVTRRLVNPGDLVQAATATRTAPLFTCQKLDVVRVFADVPEASAAGVHPGLPAEVKLYGPAGVTISGTVTRLSMALDAATRTMRVEIDLPNPDGKMLPGMYAQVTLQPKMQPS